jgi:hypothetical protein
VINLMSVIRRKPGMTRGEYLDYLQHVHGAVAAARPLGVQVYVQNHVLDGAYGSQNDREYALEFGRDSVTELCFDDFESLASTMADPYVRLRIGPDGVNFSDLPNALSLLAVDLEFEVPTPGYTDIKIMHFMYKWEDLDLDTFVQRWTEAHHRAVWEQPSLAKALRGYVQHRQVPEGNKILRYFGGHGGHVYEGAATMSFDDPDTAITQFRTYQRTLELDGFFDPSRSFFLCTREVVIFDRTEG